MATKAELNEMFEYRYNPKGKYALRFLNGQWSVCTQTNDYIFSTGVADMSEKALKRRAKSEHYKLHGRTDVMTYVDTVKAYALWMEGNTEKQAIADTYGIDTKQLSRCFLFLNQRGEEPFHRRGDEQSRKYL